MQSTLEILSLLAVVRAELITEDMLEKIAQRLPSLIPNPFTQIITGVPEFDLNLHNKITNDMRQCIPKISLGVIRSANLLRQFPSAAWISSLKNSWLKIDCFTRQHPEQRQEEHIIPMQLAAAANAIGIALGVCAAHNQEYTVLTTNTDQIKRIENELEEEIKERNQLVNQHNELVKEYQIGDINPNKTHKAIENEIIELKNNIADLDEYIESLKVEIKGSLSPGSLLLHTLNDGQAYTAEVRQGAAWGLYKLTKNGYLKREECDKISDAIRYAVDEYDQANEELQNRLNRYLPEDEEMRQAVFEVALEHIRVPDLKLLDARLNKILSDYDNVRNQVSNVIVSSLHGNPSYDFRERLAQFLPGSRSLELEQVLKDGIAWILDIVEEASQKEEGIELYKNIRWIVELLHDMIPGASDFLHRFPLRLMTLETHKGILGQYSRSKGGITQWTRYTPPLWKRGAKPEEVGVVHKRYLKLEDRSTPNSMGIYYRLFAHPILALPVIYHEYLHYGGPTGNPDKGIENETEVLIREILFARHLINKLAPPDHNALPEFEHGLIKTIQRVGLDGLGWQLNYDIEDDDVLNSLCDEIEVIYGKQLTEKEAGQKIAYLINSRNIQIRLANETDTMKRHWHPEIEWPYIDTEHTRDITKNYRQIVKQNLTYNHRINPHQRDEILNDPICQRFISAWENYKKRPYALQEFQKAWSVDSISFQKVFTYIVNRFKGVVEENTIDESAVGFLLNLLAEQDQGKDTTF